MATRFAYIHISDLHLCLQPSRAHALSLIRRNARGAIDTFGTIQATKSGAQQFGFLSLARPSSYVPSIVSGVAQFCLEHSNVVDGIIISGDVATTGMPADLNVALSFVSDPAASGFVTDSKKPTIQAGRRPIYIIPGNHDRYASNYAATNSRQFDFTLGKFLRNFNGDVGYWVSRKNGKKIGFVFADFTLRNKMDATSRIHAYGQGRVYEDVLKNLVDTTFKIKNDHPDILLNWLIHFAPFDCGGTLELIDFDRIVSAATAAGVRATLCGHTHQHIKIDAAGHVIYCAGSAGCADSENNSFVHIVRFEIDDVVRSWRENFRWNAQKLEFEKESEDR